MSSGYETVDRIRRSWRSAKPNPAVNPAWANAHMDVGILLTEIEQLRGNLSLAEEGLANYAQQVERLKPVADAATEYVRAWLREKGAGCLFSEWQALFEAVRKSLSEPAIPSQNDG